jgi:hypothetical protein
MNQEFFFSSSNEFDSHILKLSGSFIDEARKPLVIGSEYFLYESFASYHYIDAADAQEWMNAVYVSKDKLISSKWEDLIKAKKHMLKKHIESLRYFMDVVELKAVCEFRTKNNKG